MAEPIEIQCHRCGYEFVSRAPKRTMCTKCKTNLRVERDVLDESGPVLSMTGSFAALIGMAIAIVLFLWRDRPKS